METGSIQIEEEWDVPVARNQIRVLAREQGLSVAAAESLATAASELAHNILTHSRRGELTVQGIFDGERSGISVTATDDGPGIRELERALVDGYSTGSGLGLGLSSAQRLVDEFSVYSAPGRGTVVVLRMWGGG